LGTVAVVGFRRGQEAAAPAGTTAKRYEVGVVGEEEKQNRKPKLNPIPYSGFRTGEQMPDQTPARESGLESGNGNQESGIGNPTLASAIRSQIQSRLRYPLSLRRRGIQGTVVLKLDLDAAGRLTAAETSTSSGSAELDSLALEAARAAAPFPAGAAMAGGLTLRLPIEFKVTP
jgi:TonB family protein